MIQIGRMDYYDRKVVDQIVQIHLETFEGFFLTFLGKGFLRQMYSSYCFHDKSGIYLAEENDVIVGFLAFSSDMSALYKEMLKKRFFWFCWYSLGAFFRNPRIFIRLIRAFLKPKESKRKEEYVELSSIGICPNKKGQGVGTMLIKELILSTDFEKYAYISLETDAVDNEYANAFYLKNGFYLERTYETYEGRKMNEYRYLKKEKEKYENALYTECCQQNK